jgi:hypothetical protein
MFYSHVTATRELFKFSNEEMNVFLKKKYVSLLPMPVDLLINFLNPIKFERKRISLSRMRG